MRNLFAFLLLILWLVFGSWYYTCQVKQYNCSAWKSWFSINEKKEEKIDPVKLKVAYGNVFETENNISIKKSKADLILGDGYGEGLTGIANFLKEHPNTQLRITGLYTDDESNESTFDNVGLARAEAIKENLIDKGVNAEQLLTESVTDASLFMDKDSISDKDVINFKFSDKYAELNEDEVKETFRALEDVSQFISFSKDSTEVTLLPDGKPYMDRLNFYLNKNKEYVLVVDVPNTSDEGDDIVTGRAESVTKLLNDAGIESSKLDIRSRQMEGIFDDKDMSLKGITEFNFKFPDKSAKKLEEVQLERDLEKTLTQSTSSIGESINEEDLKQHPNIEFDYGSANLEATPDVMTYAEKLSKYLQENENKKVYIIGHTDNISSEDFNYRLGIRRAGAAQTLMMNHSVDTDRMKTSSQGENQPITSNSTAEGRQKNRRVEIDIK